MVQQVPSRLPKLSLINTQNLKSGKLTFAYIKTDYETTAKITTKDKLKNCNLFYDSDDSNQGYITLLMQ